MSSVWPPPAPPEYIDRTQLPANLRAPSLAPQQHDDDEGNNQDDLNDSSSLVSRHSSESDARLPFTATETSRGSREYHTGTVSSDSQLTRPPSDRQPDLDADVTRNKPSEMMRDREVSHQLKRSSAGDTEPGVQAKRLSDGSVHHASRSVVSGETAMDVQGCGNAEYSAQREHFHGSDLHEPGTRRRSSETPGTVSREEMSREEVEFCGDAEEQTRAVPPRLMETGVRDDPMVIEFTTAGAGSGGEDDVSVRVGHKRARVNSDTVHNDVVKKSFVKRPITFYGNSTSVLLRAGLSSKVDNFKHKLHML